MVKKISKIKLSKKAKPKRASGKVLSKSVKKPIKKLINREIQAKVPLKRCVFTATALTMNNANVHFVTHAMSPRITQGVAANNIVGLDCWVKDLRYAYTITAHQSQTRSLVMIQPVMIRWAIVSCRKGEVALSTAPTRPVLYGSQTTAVSNNAFRNWSPYITEAYTDHVNNDATNFVVHSHGKFELQPLRNPAASNAIVDGYTQEDIYPAPAGVVGVQIEASRYVQPYCKFQHSFVKRAPYKPDHHMEWPAGANTLTSDATGLSPLYYMVFAAETASAGGSINADLTIQVDYESYLQYRD